MKKKSDTHSRIPLADLIQEGCDTHYLCEKDKADLVRHGIDWNLVEKLPLLTELCSKAETDWQVCKSNKKIIVGELQDMARDARKLRSKLARVLRCKHQFSGSSRKIPSMSRNNKYEDIIQDLYELYYIANHLCENDPEIITETDLMQQALAMHKSLSDTFTKRACYTSRLIDCAEMRNQTAMELKNVLVEIHCAGKIAFIDNVTKASRYCMHYHQAQYVKKKQQ
ncbi:MAG TPA: hypothetical protein VHO70_14450, partial [Chitinispirillaceae bacterium]|nr:hypothetical protein [Chitinispirillaceae bacterium]